MVKTSDRKRNSLSTIRISPTAKRQLEAIADTLGLPTTGALEVLVREGAERRNVVIDEFGAVVALDPAALLRLPADQRDRILRHQAEVAASLYKDDLALPTPDRQLTAFEALNEFDPVLAPVDYIRQDNK